MHKHFDLFANTLTFDYSDFIDLLPEADATQEIPYQSLVLSIISCISCSEKWAKLKYKNSQKEYL